MLSLAQRLRPSLRFLAAADASVMCTSTNSLRPTRNLIKSTQSLRTVHQAVKGEDGLRDDIETRYITAPLVEFKNESLEQKRIIHHRRIKGREVTGALQFAAKMLGVYSKSSTSIRMARIQYELCTVPSTDTFFHDFKLPDTMMSWFSVTQLHVWMCMCRNAHLNDPDYVKVLNKELYECFQEDISARIYAMGVTDAIEVGKRTKQLVQIFWGCVVAYDEGLLYEDTVLAAALWRNMYDCRPDVPIQELEALVRYIRRETLALDHTSDDDVKLGITYFTPPEFAATVESGTSR